MFWLCLYLIVCIKSNFRPEYLEIAFVLSNEEGTIRGVYADLGHAALLAARIWEYWVGFPLLVVFIDVEDFD